MPRQLEFFLVRWKHEQAKRMSLIGEEQTLETPLITNKVFQRVPPYVISKWWKKHSVDLGCGDIVFHELRHTYLTMLASSGASSQVIKSTAGWSNIAMADVYVHSDDEEKALAANMLSDKIEVFAGTSNGTSDTGCSVLYRAI